MGLFRNILAAATLSLVALPARAEDAGAMALALAAADARDWTTARAAAERSGPVAQALVGWQALRAGYGDFEDYLAFVETNADWPGLALLRERGEAKIGPSTPVDQILRWQGDSPASNLRTSQAMASAMSEQDAAAERARLWRSAPLSPVEESTLLEAFGAELQPLHGERIAALLDAGEWAAAERSLDLLPEPARALPFARIALQAGRTGVDDLIEALPDSARADPGLTLDRFRWRVRAKLHDGARDLMLGASANAATLRNPDAWAQMRVDYSRLAMRGGDWKLAERLAANHHLTPENRHYPDLEWLAGFAALHQDQPARALHHFNHLETVVGSAISTSRALYWQGRAHEDLGDTAAAQDAYAQAADHIGTYYGQLAAEKTGATLPAAYAVPGAAIETLPDWRRAALGDNTIFRAGLWLLATGRRDEAQRFFLHLAETAAPDDTARMARLMLEAGAPWHALRLSKMAANQGAIYPAAHFPLTGLQDSELGVPAELVMAIARQESEFNFAVSSPVGAKGLMQVMPGTAEMMARDIGEPYQLARLTTDPAYNARLGAAYLKGLRDRFGASTALTASGYNAGPGRPARWLGDFGDLRKNVDPVDWVELIPFDETRNYVMRVTEAMPIYRARIAGHPVPVVPTWDLTGGGILPPPPPRLNLVRSAHPPAKPFIGPRLPTDWVPPDLRTASDRPPPPAGPPAGAPAPATATE
ncbi:lytic transglycosylase domain-containing protein (plasmid) [Paracoccus sp. TK19116]|uniref:Lytic transglycosylase domain-containing protein n=1 Tax=Paracoccus albicereus TaxID=2922394 RepID=A0ABT1MKZ6_9RHOB|nr:lytic transglycosylase domain-containing protein [Paracoccus albicereus]MCQ0968965.1 lytic transglycosylase domain-containing protein [Paracoccus albicereus]